MPHATLELISTGVTRALTTELTRIGRGKHCEFPVASNTLGREHSLIARRATGFWICDLSSSYGTWVAHAGGKPERIRGAMVRLDDGDVIDLQCPMRFRAAPGDPVEAQLVRDVAAAPEDPRRWNAYAAYLRTPGDPRARRIELGSTELFWPGKALTSPDVSLELEWAYGHVLRASLQEVRHSGFGLLETLRALLWAPATEFMTDLRISLQPAAARTQPGTAAHGIIESARHALEASCLPALRRLHFVPHALGPRLVLESSPLLER